MKKCLLVFLICSQVFTGFSQKLVPRDFNDFDFAMQTRICDSLSQNITDENWKVREKQLLDDARNSDETGHPKAALILNFTALKIRNAHISDKTTTIETTNKLLEKSREEKDDLIQAELHHFLGLQFWESKKHAEALEQFINAYDLYDAVPAEKYPHKAEQLYDYAGKYYYFRDFKSAIGLMRQVWSTIPPSNISGQISKLNTLGLAYVNLMQYDSALYFYQKGIDLAKRTGEEGWIGIIEGNISTIFFNQKKYDKALELMLKNVAISEKHNQLSDLAFAYMRVGEIYLILENKTLALEYELKAYKIIQQKQLYSYVDIISRIYIPLGKAYKANGLDALAFRYMDSGRVAKDSVEARRNVLFLTGIQHKMEAQKHRSELLLKEKQIANQRKISVSIFAGLLAVSFLGIGLYRQKKRIDKEKQRSEELLLNILPAEVANELKEHGEARTKNFEDVTILFTDFKDFTKTAARMSAEQLIKELDHCFKKFDEITTRYGIEKIKTIGDSYMCAAGLPVVNTTHAEDAVKAALEIRDFIAQEKIRKDALNQISFEIRIGVHTGPAIAGIVGVKKFAYDIWGDTVNTASRMESSGVAGKVNISEKTYEIVKSQFVCTSRGKIEAKSLGEIEMYFVDWPDSKQK